MIPPRAPSNAHPSVFGARNGTLHPLSSVRAQGIVPTSSTNNTQRHSTNAAFTSNPRCLLCLTSYMTHIFVSADQRQRDSCIGCLCRRPGADGAHLGFRTAF
ncbi:hypothetical protein TRVL_06726 [Trypanosoma vivax]|nr:hypothetical protein TRVL_06726 [Trypanosoma vivax]